MKKAFLSLSVLCVSLLTVASAFGADFRLAGVFSDRMVLQRSVEVPVWGWGEPGAQVDVDFAGAKGSAKVGEDSKWELKLKPMDASSEGRELKASSGAKEIVCKDVLVGDVWLCSGQSNMAFGLSGAEGAKELIASNEFPTIRFVNIGEQLSSERKDDFIKKPGAWKVVSKSSMDVSAVAFYFARGLQKKQNVPVGLIISAWGGSKIITWTPKNDIPASFMDTVNHDIGDTVKADEEARFAKIWNENDIETAKKIVLEEMSHSSKSWVRDWSEKKLYWRMLHCFPGWTFNAKISPLKPYAIKGVLWYQGEDDHGMGYRYSTYLINLAEAWRKEWKSDLPFFIVMLAPFKYEHNDQLPIFWMSQMDAAKKLGKSEVACTIDIGNADNIHPTKKEQAGDRLALAALKVCFGDKNSAPGPLFKSASFDGSKATVVFDNAAEGLKAEGDLVSFEIAGADKNFVPAKASISGKDSVIVEAEGVAKPEFVRYAWINTPKASLFNTEGFPALPFSTAWLPPEQAK